MNYPRINLYLFGFLVVFFLASRVDSSAQISIQKNSSIVIPPFIPTATPTPTLPFPARFIIPKLGIDAAVEPVGNDDIGTMQLPRETDKVGWYYSGYKPGEKGNAVISGHLDLTTGAPAIFYRLKELVVGDTIEVIDELGTQRIFKIIYTQTYLYNEMPIESIFGKSDSSHLNLITCTGIFNRNTHNYSQRLVLYSDLSQ